MARSLSMQQLSQILKAADKDTAYRSARNKRIYGEKKLAKSMRAEIEAWEAEQAAAETSQQ